MQICLSEGSGSCIDNQILFGRYRIVDTLGKGNFGTVFLAEHLKLGYLRAIKLIPRTKAQISSPHQNDRLPQEVRFLKILNHPGIPQVYDIEEDENYYYIIEEYVTGQSLLDFLEEADFIPEEFIVKLGMGICDIFSYLHSLQPNPIIYQDLKPEHIYLDGDKVRLIDFGVASFFSSDLPDDPEYGNLEFCAPEILLGEKPSPLSDLYSLGKVLDRVSQSSVKTSLDFKRILAKACDESPEKRFQSAPQLKSALENYQNSISRQKLNPHLISKIAVFSSNTDASSTVFSASLVSSLNYNGIKSLFVGQKPGLLESCLELESGLHMDLDGIYHFNNFSGISGYGEGIYSPLPMDCCLVEDFECHDFNKLSSDYNFIIFIISGNFFKLPEAIKRALNFKGYENIKFVFTGSDRRLALTLAKRLNSKIYVYPADTNPFSITAEKEHFFSGLLSYKRRKRLPFLHLPKRTS